MARVPRERFPLPSDLPAMPENSFAVRYRCAKPLFLHWQRANSAHKLPLPDVIWHAWINGLARSVFRGLDVFRTPADLLALAQAVRELACEGTVRQISRGIDAGDDEVTLCEFGVAIPLPKSLRVPIPHVDDALHLLGERSRARLRESVVREVGFTQFIVFLNDHIANSRTPDPGQWVRSWVFRPNKGTYFGPRLVRPLPWHGGKTEGPFDPLQKPLEPLTGDEWDRPFWRPGDEGLPSWRQALIKFCRAAVYELIHRGYPADPLPSQFSASDTFDTLVELLINRANQAIRHIESGPIEPIPRWDWPLWPRLTKERDREACNVDKRESAANERDAARQAGARTKLEPDGPGRPGRFIWNRDEHKFTDGPWKLLCRLWDASQHTPFVRVSISEAYQAFARLKKSRKRGRQKQEQIRRNVLAMYAKLNDELLAAKVPFQVRLLSVGGDEIALVSSQTGAAKAG